ncbi:hypothetical protein HRG_006519 [Hirsutella rhossiliensis]|uniref:Uncharacterized protein n=1 Tax=Hirsutella rhossiliensis TaxID=111463 RepID=A0A9P8MW03_9HYPO|nr:uncharacterized protein HRG_06519 [Hirsutella rhossiliensis]KAH0962417.1 hypothetical protein HRG_06519 [Hirsutella rhossiliensis]
MMLCDLGSGGLCGLLVCMLCEVFLALTSPLLDIARRTCELLLLGAGWFLTATRLGTYILLCLHLSFVSPSLGWFLMTVFWFGEAVTKAGARGPDVGFILAEIWMAFTMLALFDLCVSETPAMARWVIQLLTRQFHQALDADISLPDNLIRCYMPSGIGSPGDLYYRSLLCGGTMEEHAAPKHEQDALRDYGYLRVNDTWIRDVLKRRQHGRKMAQLGAPLSPFSLPTVRRRAFGPTTNLDTPVQHPQTVPLDYDNPIERSGAHQGLFPMPLDKQLHDREERDESTAGAISPIRDPEDGSESSGEDQCPAVGFTATFENPDSSPELRDGSGRGEMTAGEEPDGSRGPEGEAGRGSIMDAQLDGSQGSDGEGGPVPVITAQEPGDGSQEPEGDGGQTPSFAASGPETLLEGWKGDEMRRGPLAAVGSNGEEFDARGTYNDRPPVGLGKSTAAGVADDAPAAARKGSMLDCGAAQDPEPVSGEGFTPFLGATLAPEASIGAEGHVVTPTCHVGDPGLEASDRLLVWGPHPSGEATLVLEDSMEWESTGRPIVVQAAADLSGSVVVDHGSPMELDTAEEPTDFRGSFGEVAGGLVDDSENSMEWEETFAVVIGGTAVAKEIESGLVDSLQRRSLFGETTAGSEHMAAVEAAGRAGAVLEVLIHETAGQLSRMTISDPEALLEDGDMSDAAVQQAVPEVDVETGAQNSMVAVDDTHQVPSFTTLMEDAQFFDDIAYSFPRAVVDASNVAATIAPAPPLEATPDLAWDSLVDPMSVLSAQEWAELEAEFGLNAPDSSASAGEVLSAPVSAQGRVRVVPEAGPQSSAEMVLAPEVGQERAFLEIQAQEDGEAVQHRQEVMEGIAEPPSSSERQATEPAPVPEAPLPALPPSSVVSVPKPETPAYERPRRYSFDTDLELPRKGDNEDASKEEVMLDDAETVTARPKLVARGPCVAKEAANQLRQDDAGKPKAVNARDEKDDEPG